MPNPFSSKRRKSLTHGVDLADEDDDEEEPLAALKSSSAHDMTGSSTRNREKSMSPVRSSSVRKMASPGKGASSRKFGGGAVHGIFRAVHGGVMAPVNIATWAGNTVGNAVVDAGSTVGNTVVSGGKAIVGGTVKNTGKLVGKGSALVQGSANSLGTTVGAVTNPLFNTIRSARLLKFSQTYKPNKSKWEEGIEAIEELLDPECAAFQHMSPEQRERLMEVRKLLLKGPTQAAKMHHVPTELIFLQSEGANFDPSFAPITDVGSTISTNGGSQKRQSLRESSTFILEEYAGVKEKSVGRASTRLFDDIQALELLDEHDEDEDDDDHPTPPSKAAFQAQQEQATASALVDEDEPALVGEDANAKLALRMEFLFVPPEFTNLERTQQLKLHEMLQWDSISAWDFNIFELEALSQGRPMLFVGWAVLGAPYAQQAMARELGLELECSTKGYRFMEDLEMPPKNLYNFIKIIEQDYNAKNPYHNAIHGADVVQTLHTLIQKAMLEEFMKHCPKLHLFAILLSALVHDVAHFGTTNAFHNKLQTELAVMYNDSSVMENWHAAHAFSRMLELDLTKTYDFADRDVAFSKFRQSQKSDCNLLCNATPDQFNVIRKLMLDAILHTDMTKHFEMVNAARGMLLQCVDEDESDQMALTDNAWQILMYMLHMADISAQAKGDPLSRGWTERCFDEFFAQGDQEASLGIPISPNCDRYKVVIPESQVGFIKFVVEPAFQVLGLYIPFVQESVLAIIQENLLRYSTQQQDIAEAIEEKASF